MSCQELETDSVPASRDTSCRPFSCLRVEPLLEAAMTLLERAHRESDSRRSNKCVARDLRDAADMMLAASTGLEIIYGYIDPLYKDGTPHLPKANHHDLEDRLIWVRDAAGWLDRFAQSDQAIVVPLSVRELAEWKTFKSGTAVELELDTSGLNPAIARHVRLRGLRPFLSGPYYGPGVQILVTPPATSYSVHSDNSRHTVPQRQVRPCLARTFASRAQASGCEVVGSRNLHNAGPYGTWKVQLVSGIESIEDLKDIEIDLHLMAQI